MYEAAGWSTLGPVAMNCAAPDEGNMFLLSKIADDEQATEYLVPVIEGRERSAFAMTEPGGAGSDPGQLLTEATFDGSEYCINGLKWLITGANGAKTWIIMARVLPNEYGADGPTLFLAPGDAPGIEMERVMNSMDRNYVQGHGVVRFSDLACRRTAVLGEVGRRIPLRATASCSGAADPLHALARSRRAGPVDRDRWARTRTAFGKALAAHEGVSFMLADNEIAIHQCRLSIWHTAWVLDRGAEGHGTRARSRRPSSRRSSSRSRTAASRCSAASGSPTRPWSR